MQRPLLTLLLCASAAPAAHGRVGLGRLPTLSSPHEDLLKSFSAPAADQAQARPEQKVPEAPTTATISRPAETNTSGALPASADAARKDRKERSKARNKEAARKARNASRASRSQNKTLRIHLNKADWASKAEERKKAKTEAKEGEQTAVVAGAAEKLAAEKGAKAADGAKNSTRDGQAVVKTTGATAEESKGAAAAAANSTRQVDACRCQPGRPCECGSAAPMPDSGIWAVKAGAATPCQCQASSPSWVPTTRTAPKCIFIDLGAANANSFEAFLKDKYGPVGNCPSGGQWEAYLVEANPQFTPALGEAANKHPGQIHNFASTAAYMCKGNTSFSIDPDVQHNHWGSSMTRHFGATVVTVPTVNVIELIATKVTKADWVMLKVDIEGAEYDLLPCLAQFKDAGLVDRMYLEEHGYLQGNSAYTPEQYERAKQRLRDMGVDMPAYFSQTL